MSGEVFDYTVAFSRNIGILSQEEQNAVSAKKIGVAGLGAAGGASLLVLTRVGFSNFHIADIDSYELINFNRQIGAMISTLGQKKTEVMEKMVLDINPQAVIKRFDNGITQDSIDEFLDGVDVVVDGIDFFSFSARKLLYKRARERNIPVVVTAPLGFSAACLVLDPSGMDWRDYFAFDMAKTQEEEAILLLLGFLPHIDPIAYIDLTKIRFAERLGPSIATSVQMCSAFNVTEVLKIVLGRGRRYYLPYYHSFDTFLLKYRRGYLPRGNRSLLQRIKFHWIKKKLLMK